MNKCSYISVLFHYVFYYNQFGFLLPNEIYIYINRGSGCNVAKYRTKMAKVVVSTMLTSSKDSVA